MQEIREGMAFVFGMLAATLLVVFGGGLLIISGIGIIWKVIDDPIVMLLVFTPIVAFILLTAGFKLAWIIVSKYAPIIE